MSSNRRFWWHSLQAVLLCSLALPAASQQAQYQHDGPAFLPDPQATPGVVRTTNQAEICSPTFRTKPFRHTTAKMKADVYRAYGVEPNKGICKGGCEVDHLVPLELGGADDVKNLWPQPSEPKPGFHEKDLLENYLHKNVCEGKIPLADAQKYLMENWWQAYRYYIQGQRQPPTSNAEVGR